MDWNVKLTTDELKKLCRALCGFADWNENYCDFLNYFDKVAPYTGAWIEINLHIGRRAAARALKSIIEGSLGTMFDGRTLYEYVD